jgi:hypothetical protein
MPVNSAQTSFSDLDFESVKQNLITYLKGQSRFKDFNFEGSGLNIILDVLAYNTHYMGIYANAVANEAFLDSCKTINSAVSIAKHLNYIPKSVRSSIAYCNIEFSGLTDIQKQFVLSETFYIPKESRFSATDELGTNYNFFTTTANKVKFVGGKYVCENVELMEGTFRTISYVYDSSNESLRFSIPDSNVYIDQIVVKVQESTENSSGFVDTWKKCEDFNTVTSDSKVYFLQYHEGLYEVYFGDGIVGKSLKNGNVVYIKYLVSTGANANNIGLNETSASPSFSFLDFPNTTVLLERDANERPIPSFGGSPAETLSSIKFYAPRNYQAQDRAVTAEDYRTLLAQEYGDQAESVLVWGGEDNDPPIYGKVFISIKPKNNIRLTSVEKTAISANIIKNKNLVTIIPEIVDPDYIFVGVESAVVYDSAKTDLTSDQLSDLIREMIRYYGSTELQKFDSSLRYSKFVNLIDSFNESFLSNTTKLYLKKKIYPNIGRSASYIVNFDNELFHPISGYSSIVSSNSFGYQDSTSSAIVKPIVDAYIDDDGNGKLRIYKLLNNQRIYLSKNAGTINYITGKLVLIDFAPQSVQESNTNTIDITVTPIQKDILSRRNQILLIDEENIQINCIPETVRTDPYKSSASSFPF